MATKTAKYDQDIDPEAIAEIARWNNEGGAPRLLKRGANRRRHYGTVELEERSNGHNGIPRIPMQDVEQQLENRVADTPASASHDDREKELAFGAATQAAPDLRRENLAATVSYDLWRFSCEMPDAPHLLNNLTLL